MMKLSRSFSLLILTGILTLAAPAFAEEKPSPELLTQGRELFNKKDGLGTKSACILCHQKEKAIKLSAVQKAGDKLPSIINKYITGKSKGTAALPEDDAKMKALMAYIRYEHAK